MKLILLSDIHANLSALKAVIEDFHSKYNPDGIALLGDIVNYGMRPNEVILELQKLDIPFIANIFGNHEYAVSNGDLHKFSTERGKALLSYTKELLDDDSLDFIYKKMEGSALSRFYIRGKSFLFVHGTLKDPYWGKLSPDTIDETYSEYDYVISGHSHIPHLFEKYFDQENPEYRNKKRTIFINPGSVGQPRNHNPRAQYAFIDTMDEVFHFNAVEYDIKEEQSLYPPFLNQFYKTRLTNGI